jgi:hypothetical protein
MQLELQPVSRHWGHMTQSCHLNMPASVVYSYGGSHWQYVELSQDSLKPLLVIIIEQGMNGVFIANYSGLSSIDEEWFG